jgi:DNA-binding response OmpR family regulator
MEEVQLFSLRSHSTDQSEKAFKNPPTVILLFEDNAGDVDLLREALEEHGVEGELLVANDGEKAMRAIDRIDAEPFLCVDLIIVDLNLPKRSGREVVDHVKRSEKCKAARIAVLSSSGAQRDIEDMRRLGADKYMRKPLRLNEFLALGAVLKSMLSGEEE